VKCLACGKQFAFDPTSPICRARLAEDDTEFRVLLR